MFVTLFPGGKGRALRRAVGSVALALLVVACGKTLGEGEKPTELLITTPNGSGSFGLFECAGSQVHANLVFDGSSGRQVGDYSSRVLWTSSAPDVVSVQGGALTARAPGVASITANYLSFAASVSVTVVPILQLSIKPELTDLAENLDQKFRLFGLFKDGDEPIDISADAKWDLNGEDARAHVDPNTGVVSAAPASLGNPIQLFATLPACTRFTRTQFQVSKLQSISLDYEFPLPAGGLPVGISDRVRLIGTFGDNTHTTQNLSLQAHVTNEFNQTLAVGSGTDINGNDGLYLLPIDTVNGAFITLDLYSFGLSAVTTPVDLVTDPLVDVSLKNADALPGQDPKLMIVQSPNHGQLEADGLFTSNRTFPITRHVQWLTSDTQNVTVATDAGNAGLVTVQNVEENVEIQAVAASALGTNHDNVALQVHTAKP